MSGISRYEQVLAPEPPQESVKVAVLPGFRVDDKDAVQLVSAGGAVCAHVIFPAGMGAVPIFLTTIVTVLPTQ